MKIDTARILAMAAVAGVVVLAGCRQKSQSEAPTPVGVAERTGAALDKAAERTVEAATNIAVKAGEVAQKAADKTKDVAGKAVEKTGEALEKAGAAAEKTGADMQK